MPHRVVQVHGEAMVPATKRKHATKCGLLVHDKEFLREVVHELPDDAGPLQSGVNASRNNVRQPPEAKVKQTSCRVRHDVFGLLNSHALHSLNGCFRMRLPG